MDVQAEEATSVSPFCICTTVSPNALAALLENGDGGAYCDSHPWLAARELQERERAQGRVLPILFATGQPLELSHWGIVRAIDVVELHRASWESRVEFARLTPVHPIWTALDSIALKPGDDQLRRESLEPLPRLRQPLDERHVRPYAICETPAFILANAPPKAAAESGGKNQD
jgi:hypothetical protein